MGKGLEQTFLQKRYSTGQETYERCAPSLIIREMQNKTTKRYHFTLIRIATIKKFKKSVDKVVENLGPMCTVGGSVKTLQPQWIMVL